MIAKKDLVDGATYSDGERQAVWDEHEQVFFFYRQKMGGLFRHSDPHPEDIEDEDWDFFYPLEKINV
jgi:hypothetical protein